MYRSSSGGTFQELKMSNSSFKFPKYTTLLLGEREEMMPDQTDNKSALLSHRAIDISKWAQ
jgi:hypothetical protein